MAINRRDIKILKEINKNIFPIKVLAEKYEISERNVRYSIDNINFYLKKLGYSEGIVKKGTFEANLTDDELDNFIDSLDMTMYVFSQEERESYILTNYLFKEGTKITELEEKLKVSRTTIKKDLKMVEEYLNEFEQEFFYDENKIYITGKEKKLRHIKLLKMLEYIEIKDGVLSFIKKKYLSDREEQIIINEYVKKYYSPNIPRVVDEIEKNLKAVFTEEFKNIMGIYLIATLERIEKGYIITKKNNSDFLRKLKEYNIIKRGLSKIINSSYEYEMLHLTEYFLSGYYNDTFSENILILERFISRMLEDLGEDMDTDFLKDREITEELLKYLLPAIYRIKNNFYLEKNLNTDEIDPKLLEKVRKVIEKNNYHLKEPLREEEIFFTAKRIEKYLEHKKREKISLKELLQIIGENSKIEDEEKLADTLKEKFGVFITDDREDELDYGLINLLGKNRVYISEKELKFDEALEIGINILLKDGCIKEKSVYNLKNMVEKFGRYLFIDKKILFCYDKGKENCIKPGITMIVAPAGIKVEGEEDGNIFFLMASRNKMEHLKVISELINLIEKNNFLEEILPLKNEKEIKKRISSLLKD